MTQQQPLIHVPGRGGIWRRYLLDNHRAVNAAPWMDAIAQRSPVGTCRDCGGYLFPNGQPDRIGGRDVYPVRCRSCHRESAAHGPAPARKKGTRR